MKNADGKYIEDPILQKLMARAVCNLPILLGGGHKRGKMISDVPYENSPGYRCRRYQCERCKEIWDRKVKAK